MPFKIIRHDITKLKTDAVVNAANVSLIMGGGVCGAIFKAAGADKLREACERLAPIETGEAVITPGFGLPAKYIIHTAGPVYRGGGHNEEALLRSCYRNSLKLAAEYNCESIAFPLISSGIFGYPKAGALKAATDSIRKFLTENEMDVTLAVFDRDSFAVSGELLGAVESYISERCAAKNLLLKRTAEELDSREFSEPAPAVFNVSAVIRPHKKSGLDDLVGNLDEPFSAALLRLIDFSGKKDSEVYTRANVDRRLFSKIRGNPDYRPSKPTALAFAAALELTVEQTGDLLKRAGFALSPSRKFDVIVEYFIINRKFDIYEINEVLFSYDQPLLGG